MRWKLYVLIVERASHKLVTCNNTLTKKRAHKEEQLLIAQMNGLKLSRQLSSHSSERWIVMTRLQRLCSNTKAAIGMVVVIVFHTRMKLSTSTKLEKINFLQQ